MIHVPPSLFSASDHSGRTRPSHVLRRSGRDNTLPTDQVRQVTIALPTQCHLVPALTYVLASRTSELTAFARRDVDDREIPHVQIAFETHVPHTSPTHVRRRRAPVLSPDRGDRALARLPPFDGSHDDAHPFPGPDDPRARTALLANARERACSTAGPLHVPVRTTSA